MKSPGEMRKIRQILGIGLIPVLLSGCASSGHWYKPDMTEEGLKQDTYRCQYDARMVTNGSRGDWLYPGQGERDWFRGCMRSKGYEWVKGLE